MFTTSRLITYLLLTSMLAGLTGCFCPNRLEPCKNPPPLPVYTVPKDIQVALVLGGGGAKGIAHVGVLKALEEEEIPIDLIVGCSAGSIVGAFYADNPCADHTHAIVAPLKTNTLLNINLWTARFGLSQGGHMQRALRSRLKCTYFHELKIPFVCVATDLHTGELCAFGGGPIIPAVQASSAIPFVFVPVQHHGRVLVDGGVIDPVPVRVAKQLNPRIIVAVDLGGLLDETFPTNLFSVATRSAEITLLWQSESCLKGADVVIRPELGDIGCFDDKSHPAIYKAGYEAAKRAIPKIRELLADCQS